MSQAPHAAPTVSIESLLQAISASTTTGIWGNACFVVKNPGSGVSYVRLYADLSVLRANGAVHLADLVTNTGFRTLDEAVEALRHHPPSSSAPQRQVLTLARPSPALQAMTQAVTESILYFPVTQIAFVTMRAILVYLQTGHIEFAPLSSTTSDTELEDVTDADDASIDTYVDVTPQPSEHGEGPAPTTTAVRSASATQAASFNVLPSPKSVYRAARKFRLHTLRNLAGEAIDRQITPANCITELFESFSLKTPELFEKRLTYVLQHWNQIGAHERNKLAHLVSTSQPRAKASEAFNMIMANVAVPNRLSA
ncbi:hypothetical protein PSEUBRA_001514 [Kalmanozyma brasiliensis GHG001]|uniref:uncharacterized protein n=1 Tax=Kalmanozyma brasiliensis (strain GHG001) TaxID=1365824 RepID=UPI002867C678|nr:uncharacterized protein PSEUBRA_001514 [Kalmanozyma brasiliensis GHG001]KAF6766952.1 hypothetical protein PSEUBRA_001514 [Kalmanozyma brasiliensis GHG001]